MPAQNKESNCYLQIHEAICISEVNEMLKKGFILHLVAIRNNDVVYILSERKVIEGMKCLCHFCF